MSDSPAQHPSPPDLRTVKVPEQFRAVFHRAQDYVERYFRTRIEDPEHSTITIADERYILVRAASMSVEFFDLVSSLYQDRGEDEARQVANNLLFDVAHGIGKADARAFHTRMGVQDPIEKLSAGPIHFSYSGWAFVVIHPESSPSPDENFYLIYDHPFSFESDAWLKRGRRVAFPVCIMNAGYSSGWCEESFGIPLVAVEVECLSRGDAQCRFIMAPPSRIEERLAAYFDRAGTQGPRRAWRGGGPRAPIAIPEFFQRKRMEEALRTSHEVLEERVRERTEELAGANAALEAEIVERKRAEAALRQSEELARAIMDNSTAVMYVKDLEGRYLAANRAYQRRVGMTEEAMRGRRDEDFFPAEVARAFRANDLGVLESGLPMEMEEEVAHEDGPHVYLSSKFPLRDAAGVPYGICGISTDITERRRLEQQLQHAQRLESVGRLAGGVAHDFNNLLTAILGHVEMMRGQLESNNPILEDVEEIRLAADRAATLTRQLLAFARRQVIEPHEIRLGEVAGRLDKLLRRLIGEDVDLLTSSAPDLWLVRADPSQIEQLLVNLAVNARDAMPEGGTLTIEACNLTVRPGEGLQHPDVPPGDYVMLTVSDTGVGIPEAIRPNIFEPFFTTKEQGKGTGLGLATCYGIVRQNGGYIRLDQTAKRGATFRIYLPRAVGGAAKPLPEPSPPSPLPRGAETILLVEDEPQVRRVARSILQKQGYRVLEAGDGEEALRVAESFPEPISLLVTDMVMPRMGGKELAGRLRAGRPGLRVLFTSGYAPDTLGATEIGAAFLQKPFSVEGLVERVRAVLDQ